MPIMIVLFGDLTNAFVSNDVDQAQACELAPGCCNQDDK